MSPPKRLRSPMSPPKRLRSPMSPAGRPQGQRNGERAPAWDRGKGPRPTIRATTPPCCVTATPATSLTRTGTGRVRRSSPTSTGDRHPLHIAIENFGNDANIGAVVRTANAFAVDTVHIVGRRRWNRRGAMVTDRYQRLRHHDTTAELLTFAADAGLTVVAVDNVPGAIRLEHTALPRDCLLIFGQEGPGITDDARAGAAVTVSIAQFGSTRSINAAVAAGIAMHTWIVHWGDPSRAW